MTITDSAEFHLGRLATALIDGHGLRAEIVREGSHPPFLHVSGGGITRLTEDISVGPAGGTPHYWWSWRRLVWTEECQDRELASDLVRDVGRQGDKAP